MNDVSEDARAHVDEAIERLRGNPQSAGIFCDFDGTLSEIAQLPGDARPLPGVVETLEMLGKRYRCVAIVSGRSAHQLLEWLGPNVEIWGVHGAEVTKDGVVVTADVAAPFAELMTGVLHEAGDIVSKLEVPGVLVEDKGIMIALHYRTAVDPDGARRALEKIASDLASEHGLQIARGRMAIELRPPRDFSKATVVLERSRELDLESVAFFGDDRVDLPAFDALDVLAEEGRTTLKVAVRSDEAPMELLERADLVVDGPRSALTLLKEWAEG